MARVALLAAGMSVGWAAQAANCSDAPVSGRAYYIVNKDTGLQLDVSSGSMNTGASIIQWGAGTQANQQWTLNQLSPGIWTMRALHSGQAMDLWGYSPVDGAPIKQYTYSGNPNQQWVVTANGGAFTIASNSSKKLLTVVDKGAGTALKQYASGQYFQNWYFNPVDGKCSSGSTGPFGSFMGFNKILIGGGLDAYTASQAPFELRYAYLHSRPAPFAQCYSQCVDACKSQPGGWWGCWGTWAGDLTPGTTVTWNNDQNAKATYQGKPQTVIEQWTWYSAQDIGIAQGEQNKAAGLTDGRPDYKGAIKNAALLKSYMDDYRFLLQKVGKTNRNIIHLEPDFWGFLRVTDGLHPNDPHFIPAVVRAANPTDCANEEDSAAGMASCMISMVRKYATASTVGIHASCWDWNQPDSGTHGPKACTGYYKLLGAGKGDFIVSDAADRDAAWVERQKDYGYSKDYWWDDTKFALYLNLIKTLTEGVGKPMIIWQIPLGNYWQNNTVDHWQDNKVDYMFNRIEDLAKVHVVALQFGAGWGEQTTTQTDGHYMLYKAQNYYNKGGVTLK
jgi:hypothetical protein